jgi:hypothetical protein
MIYYSAFELITHYIPWPFSLRQDQHTKNIYIQDHKFPQSLVLSVSKLHTAQSAATYLHTELCLYADLIPAWHGARPLIWS